MLNKGLFKKSTNALEDDLVGGQNQENHYTVCSGCKRKFPDSVLRKNLNVCPKCGKHLHLTGRLRIFSVCDEGSFQEWDENLAATDFLRFPGYPEKLGLSRLKSGELDAVVTGCMTVGGNPCAVFSMDANFMMGSMGAVVGEKITRVFERAVDEKLPVLGFTVSGGARMQEGMISLMQMAKVSGAVKRHSDAGGLYLAVLMDPTSGGVTASFAMEADILISEPGALIAFAGPRVIEQTIHKKLPSGFQRAEFLQKKGFLDKVIPRAKLRPNLIRLLGYHRREDGGYGRL